MKNRKERGSLTVEAAIVLVIFIFGYAAIVSLTDFIRAQMMIQYGLNQTAKEISAYCYLPARMGLLGTAKEISEHAETFKNDTDAVIDSVVKLYEAVGEGSDNIKGSVQSFQEAEGLDGLLNTVKDAGSMTQQDFQNIAAASKTFAEKSGDYFSSPQNILKGLTSLALGEGVNKLKSYAIAAPLSKSMMKEQLSLYGKDRRGRDILERLGVEGGIDGLNFMGSTLFNDGETIEIRVVYDMSVNFPWFGEKKFHFSQAAVTRAWGAEE